MVLRLLVLILSVLVASCATINRGTTVPAGHVEVHLSPGIMLNTLDVRYGVTDKVTLGASVDAGGLVPLQSDVFVLSGLDLGLDKWMLVSGLGARAYWWAEATVVPVASLALSRTWDAWRPYVGLEVTSKHVEPWVGLEGRWGQFSAFAQIDTVHAFAALGRRSPTGSIDLQIRPGQGWTPGNNWWWRPALGVGWRF